MWDVRRRRGGRSAVEPLPSRLGADGQWFDLREVLLCRTTIAPRGRHHALDVDLGCHGLVDKSAGLGLLWRHRSQVSEIASSSLAACGGARSHECARTDVTVPRAKVA